MLFSSFLYVLLFLPVVALGHAVLLRAGGPRVAQFGLLFASLFFYAYASLVHLPLLLGSILVNWLIAHQIGAQTNAHRRSRWLWIGLVVNLCFLGSFKYVDFFADQIASISGLHIASPNWNFPLGVSFFTLTQIMYLVDCYQEMTKPVSLVNHASVVSFFPYISAGPIVRVSEIAPQFERYEFTESRLELASRGLFMFALGLSKKVIFADSFGVLADAGYASAGSLSCLEFWAFSFAYTFQIYFDFSGYSDMAVGTAWMLGFEIPQNFRSPYRAQSISEFWQRWHISLSNFITNYIYTPILRSFGRATLRTSAIATLLAMGIAGLWHGAGWTYIVWGLMHGAALATNQAWRRSKRKLPRGMGWLLTFVFVNLALVFFRSPSMEVAMAMFSNMLPHGDLFGMSQLDSALAPSWTLLGRPVFIGILIVFLCKGSWQLAASFKPNLVRAVASAGLIAVSLLFLNSSAAKSFVYFAF